MQPTSLTRTRQTTPGKGLRPFPYRGARLISLFEIDGDDYDDTYCEFLGTGRWLSNTGRHSFGRQVATEPYTL